MQTPAKGWGQRAGSVHGFSGTLISRYIAAIRLSFLGTHRRAADRRGNAAAAAAVARADGLVEGGWGLKLLPARRLRFVVVD